MTHSFHAPKFAYYQITGFPCEGGQVNHWIDLATGRCQTCARTFPMIALLEKENLMKVLNWQEETNEQETTQKTNEAMELIALIAHEIRNPLTVISSSVGLIRRYLSSASDPAEKILKLCEACDEAVKRMNRVTSDFLDVTKLDSGVFRVDLKQVDLDDLVKKVVQTYEPQMSLKGITWDAIYGLNHRVVADPNALDQVLSNLLSNAIKFAPENGSITIETWEEERRGYFRIKDSGAGVESHEAPYVFDRFFQGKQNRAQGSGLGLYLVKELLKRNGGDISLTQGNSFTFDLYLTMSRIK